MSKKVTARQVYLMSKLLFREVPSLTEAEYLEIGGDAGDIQMVLHGRALPNMEDQLRLCRDIFTRALIYGVLDD